ncbi:hypothetical protein MJ1_0774 [Nanobdella aerobiophila]|uniref:Uncharacterized protein n=1 Tax=Nanobdella aerobiophila TaxID=2586965 RepID=A0A915WSG2_9ARCH|nr:hypothetical protein [Nanobdella aerobiophila]BBL45911.1 hypothetical protein MJ1_0774 [Nanobdella aerobiophila]
MRLQGESLAVIILFIIGAISAFMLYNILRPNYNSLTPTGESIANSLSINFQLLNYYITNNTLFVYVKPSEPVNASQVFAIVNNNSALVYPYNSNNDIVNPNQNQLLLIVDNLSQTSLDQNGNYKITIGLSNDIIGIFSIKYESNPLQKFFHPIIENNITNIINNVTTNVNNYYELILYNTQSIPTPAPFQQDIAICNGSTSLVQNPYFSIVGNASSTGSTSASVTLPTGANIYLCNGGDGNGALSSYSWTAQETTQNTYASLGYQSSNVCSDSSGSTDIVVGGVAINTNEYENFVGTTFNGVNSFSYTYNVTNTSNVVISVACGWYACTSVTLPSGCQKLFDTIGGDTYETTVMGVCYNQTAGSYTVSGSLNGGGYVSVGIYEFSTIPPRLNTSLSYVNNITLYNEINSNGSNVYFFSNPSNPTGSLLYSWYEGQENTNGVSCDIWWVNISNGIPANSNITIYMDIGNTSTNYYSQYYPYVGVSYNVLGTFNYDNGNYVFNYYEKWGNLSSLPVGWNNLDSVSVSFSQNYTSFVQTSSNNYWYGLYYPLSNSNLQNRPLLLLSYYYSYPNGNTNYFGITSQTPVVSNTNYYTYYVTQTSPGYYNSLLYVSSGTATDTIGYLVYVPGSITGSYFNLYWTAVASYPPNGVMPEVFIQ